MEVDDITFNLFVNNNLPQAKMIEVEKLLMQNNEIDATIQASILNHSLNKDMAEDMIGIDDENKLEEILASQDRKTYCIDSKEVDKEKLIINSTAMNNYLTKEEILKVQELTGKFNEAYDAEISLEENLVQFYLTQRPGVFPEDAYEVVKGLKSGIDSFNFNLQKALSVEGFDYVAELSKISSELPIKEKYELYINFLAALQTLSLNNLSQEQLAQIDSFQTIRERLLVNGDVSDEMMNEAEKQIAQMLETNTLCLGSVESLKNLMGQLPNGMEAVENAVRGSENDMREKMIASMSTYIAYQNDEIESLRGQQLTPQAIAISTAAGIEEMHVLNDLNAGRTTVDKAIKILKIIGGIALFTLLAYVAFVGITTIGTLTMSTIMFAFGASTIVTIGAFLASLFVVWSLTGSTVNIAGEILTWSSRGFDIVINTWRETAWPVIKNALINTWNWIMSLFNKETVVRQEQQVENDNQTTSIVNQ